MSGRDIGASVRQRLLNKSRTQGRPFQELLQYFAMERFLYARPTMDIDFAGRVNNQIDHIKEVVSTYEKSMWNLMASHSNFNRGQPNQRGRGLRGCPSPVPRNARESANSDATRYRIRRCHYSGTHGSPASSPSGSPAAFGSEKLHNSRWARFHQLRALPERCPRMTWSTNSSPNRRVIGPERNNMR